MHLGDRARARRPAGAAAQPDHGDMTTANPESGQIRPANKPGRGRLQHTAFVVAMGAQPIGLLEVVAKLRWRGVRWLSRIPRGRGAEGTGRMAAAFAPAQTHLIACTKYGALVLGITERVLPDSERALTDRRSSQTAWASLI